LTLTFFIPELEPFNLKGASNVQTNNSLHGRKPIGHGGRDVNHISFNVFFWTRAGFIPRGGKLLHIDGYLPGLGYGGIFHFLAPFQMDGQKVLQY
jgi:hypothetical protein